MSEQGPSSGLERLLPGESVGVAMSGGVDSTLAARLLLEQGFRVRAFHLVLTPEAPARAAARAAADLLGLDLEVLDLRAAFEERIIQPFVQVYAAGQTPNPCVACNPRVKFGLLLEEARRQGAAWLATGHYAALLTRPPGQTPLLARPRDRAKDQTYFLCCLPRAALERAVFPLAGLTKAEARARAARLGLPPREESQEVCFLGGGDYRDFILSRLGPQAFAPGEFVDTEGRVMGRHRGLIHYTVGQRRGLGLPGPEPYYVLALEARQNRVVIGTRAQTYSRAALVRDLVWSHGPPGEVFRAQVQIRSRHRPARARVRLVAGGRAEVFFDQPQAAVAPGQAAAFYEGEVLLGGGWLEGT